ncbi:tyrosine-type recombinase/integrase [Microbacterium oleivorans]|nr:site-specific integrase [Microbacterium oleivorans]
MPKKRNHGDGALYFLKSRKLWRGVANAGFDANGKRVQKYVHAKSQKEARAKLEMLIAEIEENGAPLDKSMTVEAWAKHWLDTIVPASNPKPNTIKAYRSIVNNWIIPVIGRKRVALLKPSDVRAVALGITDAGRSTGTASKAHNVLSGMLEAARLDGVAGRNVARDVIAPTVLANERGALTTDEALAVLRVAARRLDGTRWWYAILAGMRQGERLGATLDAIDFDRGEFTVKWSLTEIGFKHGCDGDCGKTRAGACPQRRYNVPPGLKHRALQGRLALVEPKSGKSRTFPLIAELAEPTRRYLEATADRPTPTVSSGGTTTGRRSPLSRTTTNGAHSCARPASSRRRRLCARRIAPQELPSPRHRTGLATPPRPC